MPAENTHTPAREEIMEYLDGEGTADTRAAIETHLASCAACQTVAAEQRGISRDAKKWAIAAAPVSLRAPVTPQAPLLPFRFWRPSRVAVALLAGAAAVIVVIGLGSGPSVLRQVGTSAARVQSVGRGDAAASKRSMALQPAQEDRAGLPREGVSPSAAGPAPRAPMVIRTATLSIVVKDFGQVRQAVEAIVAQAGGFLDNLTVSGDTASARRLRGTVRVPGDRLAGALAQLRRIGQVVDDTQASEDVTDQIVDLDARLVSAHATEQRLTELLRNRSGKLSDVLDVERELARVRLDIERLDAEKTNVGRRVTYATISINISEERKAGLESGPLPIATRIRIAAADGLEAALESIALAVLLLLRAGPTLALWGLAAGLVWTFGRRLIRPSA